jgi:hypothetical protein
MKYRRLCSLVGRSYPLVTLLNGFSNFLSPVATASSASMEAGEEMRELKREDLNGWIDWSGTL